MDSRYYKLKNICNKKRQTLRSLCVGFVFFGILFVLTKFFSVSLCPVKNCFGISCFGCGMTRGFISILHFDLKKAFEYNVLSVPLFAGIVLYSVLLMADILFCKNYILKFEKQLSKKYMILIYIALLIIATIINNK